MSVRTQPTKFPRWLWLWRYRWTQRIPFLWREWKVPDIPAIDPQLPIGKGILVVVADDREVWTTPFTTHFESPVWTKVEPDDPRYLDYLLKAGYTLTDEDADEE